MPQLRHDTVRNRLLATLQPADFAALQPHLARVRTLARQTLIAPDEAIRRLYFPEVGYASVMADGSDVRAEIGLIGREGLVGAAPVLLGLDRTPNHVFVQAAGEMLGIAADALVDAAARSPSLRTHLLGFVQAQFVQTGRTASVNATHFADARLARWLLMGHDRSEGDDLAVTHEALALMLGVQRGSATLAVQDLERRRLIEARRGRITIRDRAGLIALAKGGYDPPEADGRAPRSPDAAHVRGARLTPPGAFARDGCRLA